MRELLDLFPSKNGLLDGAAYLSLFLTLATALWPKFVHLLDIVGLDVDRWFQNLYAFRDRLAQRQTSSGNADHHVT